MSAATQPVSRRVSPQAAGGFLKNNPIYVAIAILVVVTSIVEPKFLTLNNFDNIVRQFGVLVFAALGMTFVIMAGFIDLSIGGIISLVAVIYLYRREDIRLWADKVADELNKVKWPTKKDVTNSTLVVIAASTVATLYLALLDRLWAFVTNLVYGTGS